MKRPILEVQLRWRDEHYGAVEAAAAFRNYADTSEWSDAQHRKFLKVIKGSGFSFNYTRCSYIAPQGNPTALKMLLCRNLKAAGFTITRGDEL